MYRGQVIYEMPEDIYRRNKKGNTLSAMLYLLSIILLLPLIVVSIFNGAISMVIIFVILALIVTGFRLQKLAEIPNYRFKIYKNGFEPANRPIGSILTRQSYFVPFEEIDNVRYVLWGGACIIRLKNQKEVRVTVDWKDIDGYIFFSDIIKSRFPQTKLPDLDIVKKTFELKKKYLAKKISKKEYLELYKKRMEINKDF